MIGSERPQRAAAGTATRARQELAAPDYLAAIAHALVAIAETLAGRGATIPAPPPHEVDPDKRCGYGHTAAECPFIDSREHRHYGHRPGSLDGRGV